jgi:HAD superfamily hydrolase (TIGR01549 family)
MGRLASGCIVIRPEPFKAVIFDWRGTLVVTMTDTEWVMRAHLMLGRPVEAAAVQAMVAQIDAVPEPERLWADGVDSDARVHREVYFRVLGEAGLDVELVQALYLIESQAEQNPLAGDVEPMLRAIKGLGVKVAVLSDIHFDLRPSFAAAGLTDFVDAFILSFEHGIQKPQREIFQRALDDLHVRSDQALMVGDRAAYDGPAVALGITTLLLPPLTSVDDHRLHLVLSLLTN